jgi:hypothetical protein
MHDDEWLHRKLDGEALTPAERVAFEERLAASPALRATYEQLAAPGAVPALPGKDFDLRVLDAVAAQMPRRVARRVPARAWGLALAASLAAFVLGLGAGRGLDTLEGLAHPGKVKVEFVFREPGAAQVAVVGDFNAWDTAGGAMRRGAAGWSKTLWLEPGVHEYQFVIDGERRAADPAAQVAADDGFGEHNSVIHVAPAQAL